MAVESLQLATSYAATKAFAVWTNRDTGQIWNGTAFATDSAANAVLSPVTATFNYRGYARFAVPASVSAINYDLVIYAYSGSNPVTTDITNAGVQPIGSSSGLTLAQIWQDADATHFAASGSIGKSLFTGLAPGDATGGLVKNNAAMTPAAFVVAGSTSFNNVGQTTPPPVQPSLSGQ